METPVLVALIGLLGSIFAAAFAYYSTKRREQDAEWRKEKLAYYKAFVESLSGIVEGDDSPEGHKAFARATNNLLLFAPQSVIEALNNFRLEISVSNPNRSQECHDILLATLLLSIRHDVGVSPTDNVATFKPILWASGADKNIYKGQSHLNT